MLRLTTIQLFEAQVAAVDTTGARFILAAETAHVMGVDLVDRNRVTTLAVREVQVWPHGLTASRKQTIGLP